MPRSPRALATLLAAAPLLILAGCGGAGTPTASGSGPPKTEAGSAQKSEAGSAQKSETARPSIPSTGQEIDTSKAVDVVKAEVKGGEADAGPTPPSFLYDPAPDEKAIRDEPYVLVVPNGFQPVASVIPASNPMTKGKVELGKQLYFEPRVSLDGTVSCATCHDPAKGWTDNKKTSVGIAGQIGGRNAPTVLNTLYGRSMFWDGRAPSLEGQAQGPIQNTIEMGDQSYRQIVERLRKIPGYREQFRKVFGTDVTLDGMAKAIASFERTALSMNSPYDKYETGDPDDAETYKKLTDSQKRGRVLFGLGLKDDDPFKVDPALLKKANCTACHAGFNFTDELFHNIGVGYDDKAGKFADIGRYEVSPVGAKSRSDLGAFKTPTLRDIARTGPFMHDGSEKTLEEVVEYYNKGGNRNPSLDAEMKPLNLTDAEKADLVEFMKALTGELVVVSLPKLPPGPDGKIPDPAAALKTPAPRTALDTRDAHRAMTAR